jgi:hypothetical protein
MSDSWWLKVKRAQKHMVDIVEEIERYSNRHPYEIVRQATRKPNRWVFVLRITRKPDPMLALTLGDFVHNLRSALDHFVVAHVPSNRRSNASFPMAQRNIWETDTLGKYVLKDDEARLAYSSAVQSLPELTLALVNGFQPYQVAHVAPSPLGILSRLENADKHRDLIVFDIGMRLSVLTRIKHDLLHDMHPPGHFASDGAIVSAFTQTGDLTDADVNVQTTGKAHVSVRLPPLGGNRPAERFALIHIMLDCMKQVRMMLRLLEASVQYGPGGLYDLLETMGLAYTVDKNGLPDSHGTP